ncbi:MULTISPECIES: isoprenyl transferase [Corallincola]|uniref:Ditrans,polycis-undecaprenyl-diphosphate synthase ((2E,6E)-farnesyl-diphosphate specific) n=3 Tax=Corallincola TaxID=1775176 RepID=A0A368NFI4_9GAMM|nr:MULTISPECIES: isoprenyl transferase [Corallincola]RCU48870.1 isoprenyl transferase [Corallincola holothuriorum]TAA43764.1 isoprenyl transferase [Corallincola spongiicola]TCI03011.1 isoprenyl transferase [Corallincola luteus]
MSEENPFANCVERLPKHIAIIMDGNGRWAQQRKKPRILGHRAGVAAVRETVRLATKWQIKAVTLYAFSSENWRRPDTEVSLLMELFLSVLQREAKRLHKNNVRLRIIGDVSRFSDRLQERIAAAESLTQDNDGLTLNIAANYGGRWDVIQSVQKLAQSLQVGSLKPEDITEEMLSENLTTAQQGDPDLMIRTGGDCRISNFLVWQMAYAEMYFTEELWPDFGQALFEDAINTFLGRERRFGCTGEQVKSVVGDTEDK